MAKLRLRGRLAALLAAGRTGGPHRASFVSGHASPSNLLYPSRRMPQFDMKSKRTPVESVRRSGWGARADVREGPKAVRVKTREEGEAALETADRIAAEGDTEFLSALAGGYGPGSQRGGSLAHLHASTVTLSQKSPRPDRHDPSREPRCRTGFGRSRGSSGSTMAQRSSGTRSVVPPQRLTVGALPKLGREKQVLRVEEDATHRSGQAYIRPPAVQSAFGPRSMPSGVPCPRLRSKSSP